MKQLTQTLKNGEMRVLDVPFPAAGPGEVLVRNRYSLISAGTEGRTVKDARRGYLGKARARQKEVRQVIESARRDGLRTTYERVMNKLETPAALGYSCAGEVIAVGADVTAFRVGDRVACGGGQAVHAEVVAVPRNLCAHVPEGVDLRDAAFATLGAIAMQGVRQAEPRLGETAVVVGLGLIGLLTMQLLEANGVRAVGVDLDAEQVALARRAGAGRAFERSMPDLEAVVLETTRGAGADVVLITASTSSTDPVDLAGRLARQKGRVVVVGNVPTGFAREPYYRKELDLRMSCSYGPGRYDPQYEEHGVDYPIGYVRWTEQRNLQAFLDLVGAGKVDVAPLVTHVFPLEDAARAYATILERTEPFAGVLLEYAEETPRRGPVAVRPEALPEGEVRAGFVGAGSFARNVLLPIVREEAALVGVATARPNHARSVAETFGFHYCTGEAEEVLADERVNVVFVVTRHDLHAPFVVEALRRGKHVFVEKPLCLRPEELEEIREAHAASAGRLMVGFNRRFAPQVERMQAFLGREAPRAIQYRVNAGALPADHWVHDPAVGGGRIVGEVCHFVDLSCHLAGAPAERVTAVALGDPSGLQDSVGVQLAFANGSTASITYASNGSPRLEKERLEVFCGGRAAVLDDFRTLYLYDGRTTKQRLRRQDKGHREEVARFLKAVRDGGPAPIPFDDLAQTTRLTFQILTSLRTRTTVDL